MTEEKRREIRETIVHLRHTAAGRRSQAADLNKLAAVDEVVARVLERQLQDAEEGK